MSGVVARNTLGEVVRLQTIIHDKVPSAFAVEAIAYHQVLQLGIDGGWLEIMIEGVALSVIKKSQSQKVDRSLIEIHIQNIHHLKKRLTRAQLKHIPRFVNGLAHILTMTTLKEGREFHLVDSVPDFALRQLADDFDREPN